MDFLDKVDTKHPIERKKRIEEAIQIVKEEATPD